MSFQPGPPHVGFWKFFFLLHSANFLLFLWLDNDTFLWVEPASLDFIWGLHPGGGVGSCTVTAFYSTVSVVFGVSEGEGKECPGSSSLSIEHELECMVTHALFCVTACDGSVLSFCLFSEYLIKFRI